MVHAMLYRMRRWWLVLIVAGIGLVGCGTSKVVSLEAPPTTEGSAALCAHLKQMAPVVAISGDPATAESNRVLADQYAATLPYWERIQVDAPPEGQAALATIIDGIHRQVEALRTLPPMDGAVAADAIPTEPATQVAFSDWATIVRARCSPDEGETTATTA